MIKRGLTHTHTSADRAGHGIRTLATYAPYYRHPHKGEDNGGCRIIKIQIKEHFLITSVLSPCYHRNLKSPNLPQWRRCVSITEESEFIMYTYTTNTHTCPYAHNHSTDTNAVKIRRLGRECAGSRRDWVDTRKADHPPGQGMGSGERRDNAGDCCRLPISPSAPVELLSILGVGRHKSNKVSRSRGTHRRQQLFRGWCRRTTSSCRPPASWGSVKFWVDGGLALQEHSPDICVIFGLIPSTAQHNHESARLRSDLHIMEKTVKNHVENRI